MAADIEVRVVVDERAAAVTSSDPRRRSAGARAPGERPAGAETATALPTALQADAGGLNPRYVFDRWVVGPHNEYATAVARSVADAPATAYNPVFIYADTGLGKTHLIQAIAHEVLVADPRLRVKYVTCEQFTDDFISGVSEKGRVEGFKQQYRANDVLLIDDVQFLAGKQGTQVEFFHTFNALYEADRQIVLTSDRQPRELEELDDRLRSRFGQGVVVDIGRPDVETRIAILRRQVKVDGNTIGEPEALEYIASRVSTNIRELVGALRRVVGFASITHSEVTLEVAREALKDILPPIYSQPITIDAGTKRGRPPVRLSRERPARRQAHRRRHLPAPHRHVSLPRAHRGLAAADRRSVRRSRSQHRAVWRQQDRAAPAGRPRPSTPRPHPGHHVAPADRSLARAARLRQTC